MKKLLFAFCALQLFVLPIYSEVEAEKATVNFLLPIDWTEGKQINLAVKIPNNFVAIQPPEAWGDANVIEFIPEGEDANNWSEIITINRFVGKGISAFDFSKSLQKLMIDASTNGTVLKDDQSTQDSYKRALMGLAYDYQGRHEVIGAVYYSGPADCVGVQYTIRPDKNASDQETFAQIEDYFSDNTDVISN